MSALSAEANQHLETAMALHRQGNLAAAEDAYRTVLAEQPDQADALHLLGTIRADAGDADEGIAMIERALRVFPAMPDAHFNLGNIHRRQGDMKSAARHFRATVKLQPENVAALANLGGILTHLKRYAEGERYCRRAIGYDPTAVIAKHTLAALHEIRGRFDETLSVYDEILAGTPNDVETHYLKSLALLLRGRLTEGWREYKWRFQRPANRALYDQFSFPYWQGEPLEGKCLLVWTEQGPGDEMLMGTMLPDVVRMAGHVVIICSERMAPLFARAFPAATVIPADNKPKDPALLADISFQASFSDLGAQLRPSLDSFPATHGYLTADTGLADEMRHRYLHDDPDGRLVGISWRSRNPELEGEKSMPLSRLADVLRVPGCTFVNLQYGDCTEEIANVTRKTGISIVHDMAVDPVRDLPRFAAQVAAMDLVISVSNTTVHTAGALGRPTWVMIPGNRGRIWYWFLDRDDSPWYGSLRLFRNPPAGDWTATVRRVAANLKRWREVNTPQ